MPSSKENDIESKQRKKIELEKERILKTLLEQGELTKDEIALNTGLKKGSGAWPAVKKTMDELINEKLIEPCTTKECEERRFGREREVAKQQEIEKKERIGKEQKRRRKIRRSDSTVKRKFALPKKRGPKPKVWIINQDILAIHTIFNKYPNLQDSLWGQEWVRDLIVKNRLDTRALEGIEGIEELKKMLKLSPHFFKLCVNYEDLYGLTLEWDYYLHASPIELSPREIAGKLKEILNRSYAHITAYRNLFAFCYFMDEFDGKEIDQGYEIVEGYTRQRLRERQKSRQDAIISAIEKVLIPTMKMFFDNINEFDTLNLKNLDDMKTLQTCVQDYTASSNRIKRIRNEPDWEDKIDQYYNDQEAISLEILDTLKSMGIIKNY
jgi:hypothetical protein